MGKHKMGRYREFRYSTRALETQRLLLAALEAYRNDENKVILDPEIEQLKDLVEERKQYMLMFLAENYGLEVPENWTA